MSTEDFNALPLKVRRFIESEISCLSCGKTKDLDLLLEKYYTMENNSLYTLRNGAVSFMDKKTELRVILYPLKSTDSESEVRTKLQNALRINAVRPESFSDIKTDAIKAILKPKK